MVMIVWLLLQLYDYDYNYDYYYDYDYYDYDYYHYLVHYYHNCWRSTIRVHFLALQIDKCKFASMIVHVAAVSPPNIMLSGTAPRSDQASILRLIFVQPAKVCDLALRGQCSSHRDFLHLWRQISFRCQSRSLNIWKQHSKRGERTHLVLSAARRKQINSERFVMLCAIYIYFLCATRWRPVVSRMQKKS